ncbi:MAG: hypothetical protein EHM19_02505 [Candidatus Latescibacterota bacterium]|nr:MAG: hypothetical protein EHM19_02505 [Candidatus Latescibacterota bacterium]
MKLLRAFFAVAASVVMLVPVASADILLCDYLGYDYTSPMPHNLNAPNSYFAIGDVDNINPAAVITDPANYEYTFCLKAGTLTAADTLAGMFGRYYYMAGDGTFYIHSDAKIGGTHRDYGLNPPNATAPGTFEDGTLILGAEFDALTIIVNLNTFTASLNGTLTFYCGEEWGSLPCYEGWTFAGETIESGIPGGYTWAVDGVVYVTETAVEQTNWTGIKKLFQ